jgi:1,4-alpha-glucan branching enzyme
MLGFAFCIDCRQPRGEIAMTRKLSHAVTPVRQPPRGVLNAMLDRSLLSDDDLYLFNEGSHVRLYEKLGAHLIDPKGNGGAPATCFAVWAPNAAAVSVMGDFNGWDTRRHPLKPRGSSGIWEGCISGARKGQAYKFHVTLRHAIDSDGSFDKTDPFASYNERPPKTASIIWDLDYHWGDAEWMHNRAARNNLERPISIYEVHLASWRHIPEDDNRSLTYREMAVMLAEYVTRLGFTHVEFLPLMEHPFGGSWGYQCTGFFAPTSRFGTPQDFMYLVDYLHQHGIGVILDWVPSHFPTDAHGLARFDGTHLYEHADPRQGFHPDWGSAIFNYGRHEVRSFLISSAMFWLEVCHVDGLRVDAVASMLYLDYSRQPGEWIPNEYGGNENLGALTFLRRFNQEVYKHHADVQTIAEESTAWPMVSRPLYLGGLGFGFKWDMGWMHDTLQYMRLDPIHRKFHHNQLTFRQLYAYHENFVLPLSHDEVVHGKSSLLGKMPGDTWQKFANLRLLYADLWGQPGKKLLFMGGEFGQWDEWDNDSSLQWHLLQWPEHQGVQRWVSDLNRLLRAEPAMYEADHDPAGFEWVDCNDSDASVLTFLRHSKGQNPQTILVALNFTPVPRLHYRVGVPRGGWWREVLNSDAPIYGGVGLGNAGGLHADAIEAHGRPCSLDLLIPPLAALFLKCEG